MFALLADPRVVLGGARACSTAAPGALAAAGAAGAPFLTYYAQETRMYSLVVLLSILASASFALAFVRGERAHVVWLGLWLALLLYTHTWGLFLAAAMGGRVAACCGAAGRSPGATARGSAPRSRSLYAPWLPGVALPGRAHRRAVGGAAVAAAAARLPRRPVRLRRAAAAGVAVFFACAAGRRVDRAVRVLAGDRGHDGRARVAVLADRARLGDALPRGRARAGAARAGLGGLARARAGPSLALVGRRRRVAAERPAADQEQRADGLDRRRAVDPPGRSRRSPPSPSRCPRCTAICPRASST